ncbi:unnamed protein product [Owenia fusiformis]|uniref:Uncharacterized protein n=1 Tax=Owenia fusiformis TaxID=6347 RepID=A0A8S4MY27_OWEFU|nr:unnamed protein product [Owenia fusiformis]
MVWLWVWLFTSFNLDFGIAQDCGSTVSESDPNCNCLPEYWKVIDGYSMRWGKCPSATILSGPFNSTLFVCADQCSADTSCTTITYNIDLMLCTLHTTSCDDAALVTSGFYDYTYDKYTMAKTPFTYDTTQVRWCYHVPQTPATSWAAANETCEENGGILAQLNFDSARLVAQIPQTIFTENYDKVYFGARRFVSDPTSDIRWSDDTMYTIASGHWLSGQPDNVADACVITFKSYNFYKWEDIACSESHLYMCKYVHTDLCYTVRSTDAYIGGASVTIGTLNSELECRDYCLRNSSCKSIYFILSSSQCIMQTSYNGDTISDNCCSFYNKTCPQTDVTNPTTESVSTLESTSILSTTAATTTAPSTTAASTISPTTHEPTTTAPTITAPTTHESKTTVPTITAHTLEDTTVATTTNQVTTNTTESTEGNTSIDLPSEEASTLSVNLSDTVPTIETTTYAYDTSTEQHPTSVPSSTRITVGNTSTTNQNTDTDISTLYNSITTQATTTADDITNAAPPKSTINVVTEKIYYNSDDRPSAQAAETYTCSFGPYGYCDTYGDVVAQHLPDDGIWVKAPKNGDKLNHWKYRKTRQSTLYGPQEYDSSGAYVFDQSWNLPSNINSSVCWDVSAYIDDVRRSSGYFTFDTYMFGPSVTKIDAALLDDNYSVLSVVEFANSADAEKKWLTSEETGKRLDFTTSNGIRYVCAVGYTITQGSTIKWDGDLGVDNFKIVLAENSMKSLFECSFAKDDPNMCGMTQLQAPADDFDWSLNGQSSVRNYGQTGGASNENYMFIESSTSFDHINSGDIASIQTPNIGATLGKDVDLNFKYFMYGSHTDTLTVQIQDVGKLQDPETVFEISGEQHKRYDEWTQVKIGLPNRINGNAYNVIFTGKVRGDIGQYVWLGDISVTDIKISEVTGGAGYALPCLTTNWSDWVCEASCGDAVRCTRTRSPTDPASTSCDQVAMSEGTTKSIDCALPIDTSVALFECGFSRSDPSMCGMEQSSDDDFNWELNDGDKNRRNFADTGGAANEDYMFIESSTSRYPQNSGDKATISTSVIQAELGKDVGLSFKYFLYGADTGTLLVEIQDADKLEPPIEVFTISGEQQKRGDPWTTITLGLPSRLQDKPYRVMFTADILPDREYVYKGDISVTDIRVGQFTAGEALFNCGFEKTDTTLCGMKHQVSPTEDDDFAWTLNDGETANRDYLETGAPLSNNYMYIESSPSTEGFVGQSPGDRAIISTPAIQGEPGEAIGFSFDHYMYGEDTGKLIVQLQPVDLTQPPVQIFSREGEQQTSRDPWESSKILLPSDLNGGAYYVQFVGEIKGDESTPDISHYRGDTSIGNIEITASGSDSGSEFMSSFSAPCMRSFSDWDCSQCGGSVTTCSRIGTATNDQCGEILEITQQMTCPADKLPINGQWSMWSDETCNGACGTYACIRTRQCNDPAPKNGGNECDSSSQGDTLERIVDGPTCGNEWSEWSCPTGCLTEIDDSAVCFRKKNGEEVDLVETKDISVPMCPVNGMWSPWSSETCDADCGTYVCRKTRSCTAPAPSNGGALCGDGSEREEDRSATKTRTVFGMDCEAAWSEWSCPATCIDDDGGSALCTRRRRPDGWEVDEIETKAVTSIPLCPVDGMWTDWTTESCLGTCGTIKCVKYRYCTNPAPANGGLDCGEESVESVERIVDGPNCDTEWSAYTCSGTCVQNVGDTVTCTRRRRLDGEETDTVESVEQEKPLCARWLEWTDWGACSVTCGGVGTTQTRTRECSAPPDEEGIGQCSGSSIETRNCGQVACPEWTTWATWSTCEAECGAIETAVYIRRTRACIGMDALMGITCEGDITESKRCADSPCVWEPWTTWSVCSVPCGGISTTQTRSRICPVTNADGSIACFDGEDDNTMLAQESRECGRAPCPAWSEWSPYTNCPVTCGAVNNNIQYMTRTRTCTDLNIELGLECEGGDTETVRCGNVYCSWNNWGEWPVDCPCGETVTRSRTCSGDDFNMCDGGELGLIESKTCDPCPVPVDGVPGEWSPWGDCSTTCGEGVQYRERACDSPAPANGGADCLQSDLVDSVSCNVVACPVDGVPGQWSPWGDCSTTCGEGVQYRERACDSPAPANGGADCLQSDLVDSVSCNVVACPVDGVPGQWSPWGDCSTTCGEGVQYRERACDSPAPANGGANCIQSDLIDSVTCNVVACPVDGVPGEWSPWGDCSTTCGEGVQYRERACDSPAPSNGGADCIQSDLIDSVACNIVACPVDGVPGEWSPWGDCSTTCGEGVQYRERACDSPAPSNGGADCTQSDLIYSVACNIVACPVDGVPGEWSPWGDCSTTCGEGVQYRERACDSPAPSNGGADCLQSDLVDSVVCNAGDCVDPPVDGVPGEWSPWGDCSTTCGEGVQYRERACDSPVPSNGGADCLQSDLVDSVACNAGDCVDPPVDGVPGEWSPWGDCSTTCGEGVQYRERACDSPAPSNGGADCLQSDLIDSVACNAGDCIDPPVDGVPGEWSPWGDCSTTCGEGVQYRERACDSPAPSNGGADCLQSDLIDSVACNAGDCIDPPVDGVPGEWSPWEDCSTTCGEGVQYRERACDSPVPSNGGADCLQSDLIDSLACNAGDCVDPPVDGVPGEWSPWGDCSTTCGEGVQYRERACDSPAPSNGGTDCLQSDLIDSLACNAGDCVDPPVDGVPGEWSPWGDCSTTCGEGVQYRERACDSPVPSNGGADCLQSDLIDSVACNAGDCVDPPVDGVPGEWSPWGDCSTTCGEGVQYRERACDSPAPSNGGADCLQSDLIDSVACNAGDCVDPPVDGVPGEWSPWGDCSTTCGEGVQYRERACDSPVPSNGGADCLQSDLIDSVACNAGDCVDPPVDGVPGEWSPWGDCSTTCGEGVQYRERACDSPVPSNGGADCIQSDLVDSVACNAGDCVDPNPPVDGNWGEWEMSGVCSVTCGGGVQERIRVCDKPAPANGGSECTLSDGSATALTEYGVMDGQCNTKSCECSKPMNILLLVDSSASITAQGKTEAFQNVRDFLTLFIEKSPIESGVYQVGLTQFSSTVKTEFNGTTYGTDKSAMLDYVATIDHLAGLTATYDGLEAARNDLSDPDRYRQTATDVIIVITDGASGDPVRTAEQANLNKQAGIKQVAVGVGNSVLQTELETIASEPASDYVKTIASYSELAATVDEIHKLACIDPIDGAWGPWKDGTCDLTCGNQTKTRTRECDNPKPLHDGAECVGESTEVVLCAYIPCPVNGGVGQWSDWGECSTTCGDGEKTRTRACDSPAPANGGANCSPDDLIEILICNVVECPVNGGYAEWSVWSSCSTTCGGGEIARERTCTDPAPAYGGDDCVGDNLETDVCNTFPCPGCEEFMDIALVVDTAGNDANSDINKYLIGLTEELNHAKSRVALYSFSDTVTQEFSLEDFAGNETSVSDAISTVSFNGGTTRDTNTALMTAGDELFSAREDAMRAVILVTTGASIDPTEASIAAESLRSEGIEVFHIAIGAEASAETASIASVDVSAHSVSYDSLNDIGANTIDFISEISLFCKAKADGYWSVWSAYGECSVTCGGGFEERTRTCDGRRYGGLGCTGATSQTRVCNDIACPVNGVWSDWYEWSACTTTCGGGTRESNRECNNPAPSNGGDDCAGDSIRIEECSTEACPDPIDGVWGEWSAYECSTTCGGGVLGRSRNCDSPAPQHGGLACPGEDFETTDECNTENCPIDGNWGGYGPWSDCTVTCGGGKKWRTRTCDDPAPAYGGADCTGSSNNTRNCNTQGCPIDGAWSVWPDWNDASVVCSVTCGGGTKTRYRTCTDPAPQNGGAECPASDPDSETHPDPCNIDPCPIDGYWEAWNEWSVCSVSCGEGSQSTNRTCVEPEFGGEPCSGASYKTRTCTADYGPCPIDGVWTDWGWAAGASGECSVICGGGIRTRIRECEGQAYGGLPCDGPDSEDVECNTRPCDNINGQWSSWASGGCSITCGDGGIETFTRSCSDPAPKDYGEYCAGEDVMESPCDFINCPVNGGWSNHYSSCSVGCGVPQGGVITNNRVCDNPAPQFEGEYCSGSETVTSACNVDLCCNQRLDITFAVDMSSYTFDNPTRAAFIAFFDAFIDALDSGADRVGFNSDFHIALVTYDESGNVEFPLNQYETKEAIKEAFRNRLTSTALSPATTNIEDAINTINTDIWDETLGDRPDVDNRIIIMGQNTNMPNSPVNWADITRTSDTAIQKEEYFGIGAQWTPDPDALRAEFEEITQNPEHVGIWPNTDQASLSQHAVEYAADLYTNHFTC